MRPVNSYPSAPINPQYPETDRPSPNIEPNSVPFEGQYGRVDPNALTREQVEAELAQAKIDGLMASGEQDYPPAQAPTGVSKTRQQVQDELAEAKAAGKYSFGELDYP